MCVRTVLILIQSCRQNRLYKSFTEEVMPGRVRAKHVCRPLRSIYLSRSLSFELRNCANPLFCCEAATDEEHRGRTLKFHNRLKSCALSQVVINKWDLYVAGRQNGDIRDLIYSSNHLQIVLFALTVFAPLLLLFYTVKIYYQNEWCTNLILVFVYTVSEALFY